MSEQVHNETCLSGHMVVSGFFLNQYRDGESTNLEASKLRARLTKWVKVAHERNAEIAFIGVLSCSGDLQKLRCSLNPVSWFQYQAQK